MLKRIEYDMAVWMIGNCRICGGIGKVAHGYDCPVCSGLRHDIEEYETANSHKCG